MAIDTQNAPETGEGDWYSDATATFGDRLAGAREAAGLSQKELAQRLGIRHKTVKAWEEDLTEPRSNRLQMLAGMLNVSIMWLLTGRGDGVDGPDIAPPLSDEAAAILPAIREIKTEISGLADRLGQMEARLRRILTKDAA